MLVKNSSGADRGQFDVLGITRPLFAPSVAFQESKNRIVLDCTSPRTSSHTGKFVVLAEPIKAGQVGRAFASGVFPAKLEIVSAGNKFADVKASTAELKTGSTGARSDPPEGKRHRRRQMVARARRYCLRAGTLPVPTAKYQVL